jgi:hypothetical protein
VFCGQCARTSVEVNFRTSLLGLTDYLHVYWLQLDVIIATSFNTNLTHAVQIQCPSNAQFIACELCLLLASALCGTLISMRLPMDFYERSAYAYCW